MQQKAMYKADINRQINGVIKVAQNDTESIRQELSEYIVTRELRRHFSTFFSHYEQSLAQPTDRIGVWISGFFGSGKSHFLKMLSYLLSNPAVAGRPAVEYFENKFDDPMMYAQLERCAAVPTETILFNIDAKSPLNKDKTAILRVFARVFYEHLGFYGSDLRVVRLEQFIERSGKSDAFRAAFQRCSGEAWEDARDTFAFLEDDIVTALCEALGMSETAARNWFSGAEETDLSIDRLADEIHTYIKSRGKNFRLIFMVDEVGQYIGADSDLMLNLQTLVEEIGSRCGGRVWVMVTSQEAIDSITKISGNDFSKIQGRFDTRLSLSSSSVDEVIKKRILAKTEDATHVLAESYAQNAAAMKNLFSFRDAVLDLKGYSGEGEFIETFPFVPYQFRLLQNVLAQIRQHGNSGKHLSGGERSMLSGFQEAAQKLCTADENALVPFSRFYDTVHTFLESTIRRVIDRCQTAADNHDGLEGFDVEVLKLLYLIRYVDDVKANVETLVTLLIDDIRVDKLARRTAVQDSLNRLLSQNYISRSGEIYTFLTDDEQDIAREIRRTPVDGAKRIGKIAEIVFGTLYPTKKFRYETYDFAFDRFVDETPITLPTGAMRIDIVTEASDLHGCAPEMLVSRSSNENALIVRLSDTYRYGEELEEAMRIRQYAKTRNIAQLPDVIQRIIRERQGQATAYEKQAAALLADAIANAEFFAAGERLTLKAGSAKDKLDAAMKILVESVYSKLRYLKARAADDAEILRIAGGEAQMGMDGRPVNAQALDELEQYLTLQHEKMLPTSMGDVQRRFSAMPYGWPELDIAAVTAGLIAARKITVQIGGVTVAPDDRRLPDYLRRRSEVDKALLVRHVAIPDSVLRSARQFLRDYFGVMDVPADEDGLVKFVQTEFTKQRDAWNALLRDAYAKAKYPGRDLVEQGVKLCDTLLAQRRDSTALLAKLNAMQDDLLNHSEDFAQVTAFFKAQRPVYDTAAELLARLRTENDYLQADRELMGGLLRIREILSMPAPYARIGELPALCGQVRTGYDAMLEARRQTVHGNLQAILAELHQTAGPDQMDIVRQADDTIGEKKRAADAARTITELDALMMRTDSLKQQYLQRLLTRPAGGTVDRDSGDGNKPTRSTVTVSRSALCTPARLCSTDEIEQYVNDLREMLLDRLSGHDELHIL